MTMPTMPTKARDRQYKTRNLHFIEVQIYSLQKIKEIIMPNRYKTKKAAARQMAIDWQHSFNERSHSYEELAHAGTMFKKLGRRYGLLREFRENGIL